MKSPFVIIGIIAKVPAIGGGVALSHRWYCRLHAKSLALILLGFIFQTGLFFQQVAQWLLHKQPIFRPADSAAGCQQIQCNSIWFWIALICNSLK
ncbi:hypothetical protein [Methylobacillus sp.]|uniref:hypothetical protein n=1 Tax=Methylobacillus sp. TaxID=56818 RepID=UPI0012C27294|nr:hypothetical protein [Methylobacillus sp.]MPS49145.1 hypothetical protein [Methylobacillus sp.]